MSQPPSIVALSIAIARVTLTDRIRRRKLISGILVAMMVLFALGNWPLSKWLNQSIWLMLLWWGFCAFLCLFMVMLALYDALSVIKEERAKLGLDESHDVDK